MSVQLHNLQPAVGSRQTRKRLGRGNSSGKGAYSGKGIKGQRARSGGRGGLKFLGYKRALAQIPQKRGFVSLYGTSAIVSLQSIDKVFAPGDVVSPMTLQQRGLISDGRRGVKVLGTSSLTKKFNFQGIAFSASARAMVEKSGSAIQSL